MSSSLRRRHLTTVDFESLETRQLLAAFGTPWPEPRELTISFPADEVAIGSYTNNIRATFDQIATRQQWEELVLRAYQTWAINADINVGLRNDYDLDFGVPGLSIADPRFGEFRIGAIPQTGLLASSVPFQSVAGTYSGDIVLNSDQKFKYHDWADGIAPDPATLGEFDRDLFSLLLHETGNTLGVDDSLLDWTAMFRQYTVPKGVLAQEDIAGIQSLYGARSDPYELVDNGQLQVAALIPTPVGFDPATDVIRTRGSLVNAADVDYYEITPIAGQDAVTIRLQAAGISLLKSNLEVLDETGQLIDEAEAASVFANDNTLQITGLQSHSVIYLRVSATDPADVYAVGDYQLEVDYRTSTTQAADPVTSSYDSGADSLFTNFLLVDDEQGTNDTVADAVTVNPLAFHPGTRYEFESSVSSASDVDVWKVTAPAQVNGRLTVNVAAVGAEQPGLNVHIVDSSGESVGASGWLRPDGTWTLQVAQPEASQDYYLSVGVDTNSAVRVGNYVVTAEFTSPSTQLNELVSGDLSSSADEFVRWTAGKTMLFRFDLSAMGGAPGDSVKLTIYDAHTQEMRLVVSTTSGVTRTAFAWLPQGDYILRFTAFSESGNPVSLISYSLAADGISDDQDEDEEDPGDDPYNDPYAYYEENPDPYSYYDYEDPYQYDSDYGYGYEYEYY